MLEIIKTKSAYWIIGYIKIHGGPFETIQQAEEHLEGLKETWPTQAKY